MEKRNQHVLYPEQGAQYNLALCYQDETGEKDEQKSIEWYKKATEQGHANAQYHHENCMDIQLLDKRVLCNCKRF